MPNANFAFRRVEEAAFTLVELLAVMAIMAVLVIASIPAINGVLKGDNMDNGARLAMNLLSIARNRAISQHQLVRFMVVTDSKAELSANNSRISLWYLTSGENPVWTQFSAWENLPVNVVLDPNATDYCPQAVKTLSQSNFLFSTDGGNTFTTTVGSSQVTLRYVEFTPYGGVRMPGATAGSYATGPDLWFGLATGQMNGGAVSYTSARSTGNSASPMNWAAITANVNTGRFKLMRP